MALSTPNNLMEKPADATIAGTHWTWSEWWNAVDYLWSRRLQIALWTGAGFIFSGILAFNICKFPASVQLMPPDSSSAGGLTQLALPSIMKSPGLAGMLAGDLLGGKSTGALFIKVLESRTVEDNVVDHFDLRKHYRKKYFEDARNTLESNTAIAEDKKSGVIAITVRDRDARFAAALASGYVEELDHVMSRVATSAARRERIFIEQRLIDENKALEDAEQKLSRFSSGSMLLNIPEQERVMLEASARMQGQLIAAHVELEGLQQSYTPESFQVRTVQARINEIERALARLNMGDQEDTRKSSSNPYPSVKRLPILGLEWVDLYRSTKIHETVYELLTQQYEAARIQEARDIPTVKVLDKAVVPEKRHPGILLVLSLGTMVSIALACTGLLLQRFWQSWDAGEPRRVLISTLFPRKKNFSGH